MKFDIDIDYILFFIERCNGYTLCIRCLFLNMITFKKEM